MLLELARVTKTFAAPGGPQPVRVLENLDLEVEGSEAVAVVGPSGSGKSTLLHLIGGLDSPDSGRLSLQGQDLASLTDAELARVRNRKVGFVFQLHHLLPQCTVLENVLLPTIPLGAERDLEAARNRACSLLQRVGLAERLEHRPGQLSGGECQRAAVARALINRPQLLLADEPTGSLDRASADKLADLLLQVHRSENVALVVVTHSEELARRMDRVYRLEGGKLERLESP